MDADFGQPLIQRVFLLIRTSARASETLHNSSSMEGQAMNFHFRRRRRSWMTVFVHQFCQAMECKTDDSFHQQVICKHLPSSTA
jgi:hypothetical protein